MPAGQPRRNEGLSRKDEGHDKGLMRAEIKAGLEEMKPTELEANQGETGAGVVYCNWALYVKGLHILTALQG
jgi:hypothetical protein